MYNVLPFQWDFTFLFTLKKCELLCSWGSEDRTSGSGPLISRTARVNAKAGLHLLVEANFAHLFPTASSVASPWFLNFGHGGHSHNVAMGKCYKPRLLGEPVVTHFITSTPLVGER